MAGKRKKIHFSPKQDPSKEMRPFEAAYGETGNSWVKVAAEVSRCLKQPIIDRQVKCRLKQQFVESESAAKRGSGMGSISDGSSSDI